MHRVSLIVLMSLAATPHAHANSCATIPHKPSVLTPAATALRPGGGIAVAYVSGTGFVGDPFAIWQLRDTGKPVVRHVAPGLDVLLTDGPAVLEDEHHAVVLRVDRAAPAAASAKPVAAPAPTAALLTAMGTIADQWRASHLLIRVTVPRDVVALVMFDATGKDAWAWSIARAPATEVVVFEGGSCSNNPEGTREPFAGEKIRLAWLDESGRLSAPSAPITIKLDKPR